MTFADLANAANGSALNSYPTASVSPGANNLILVTVSSARAAGTIATPTVTGASMTWVQILSQGDAGAGSQRRITMFRGMSASPGSGALTLDFGGQSQDRAYYAVEQVTGTDTSGTNGSGAIVQSAGATNTGTQTGITVTLAAITSGNATYGGVRKGTANTPAVGSGFTQLAASSATGFFNTEYQIGTDNTVDWTWGSESAAGTVAVAIEVLAAAVVTGSINFITYRPPFFS